MTDSIPTSLDELRIRALLERLELNLDQSCAVPGCVHIHGAVDHRHDVLAGRAAA